MASYIRTYTGVRFVPTEPEKEKIQIEDIAHALPMLCRGNGHVKTFWSVGEHCILCAKEALARGLGSRLALACLLHDASECYLSDIPRPFKQFLPEYQEHEDRLLNMIYEKYLGSSLTGEEQRALRQIDDDMLWYDLEVLIREPQQDPPPQTKLRPDFAVRPFEEVEQEYLELFEKLRGEL